NGRRSFRPGSSLPCACTRRSAVPENEDSAPRVLLVEADEALAMQQSELLRANGFKLKRVGQCNEGLEAVNRDPFDVVLIDLDQGGNPDGLEMCRLLKANPA